MTVRPPTSHPSPHRTLPLSSHPRLTVSQILLATSLSLGEAIPCCNKLDWSSGKKAIWPNWQIQSAVSPWSWGVLRGEGALLDVQCDWVVLREPPSKSATSEKLRCTEETFSRGPSRFIRRYFGLHNVKECHLHFISFGISFGSKRIKTAEMLPASKITDWWGADTETQPLAGVLTGRLQKRA